MTINVAIAEDYRYSYSLNTYRLTTSRHLLSAAAGRIKIRSKSADGTAPGREHSFHNF